MVFLKLAELITLKKHIYLFSHDFSKNLMISVILAIFYGTGAILYTVVDII